ncbi:MAG TPA: polyprenyl synthetase family protein [Candidatus Saccharimonadales bacterium]|nr:polyprenyl synthetase family protein [Candidatus Saccharimonadales bacterium]
MKTAASAEIKTPKQVKQAIDQRVANFFELKISEATVLDPLYGEMLGYIASIASDGKRLRPYLAYVAYRAHGGRDEELILDVALSQELYHLFLLIHDDVMDRDDVRHGHPTINAIYRRQAEDKMISGEAAHYGDSLAIVAGDVVAGLASEPILQAAMPDKIRLELLKVFNRLIFTEVAAGQQLDLMWLRPDGPQPSIDQLNKINRYKTASYTFIAPLKLGAILAGASQVEASKWEEVAVPLGLAFQLHNDLSDLFSDETDWKQVMGDVVEGKPTIPIMLALEKLDGKDREELAGKLGIGRPLKKSEVENLQELIVGCGAKQAAHEMINDYLRTALNNLKSLNLDAKAEAALADVAAHLVGAQMVHD